MKHGKTVRMWLSGRPENTRRTYLVAWHKWCTQSDHSRAGVLKHFQQLKGLGYSDGTVKLHYWALSSIYEMLTLTRREKENPVKAVRKLIRIGKRLVRPTKTVPFSMVKRICNSPPWQTETGIRDRAFLAVLFGCGFRRFEARELVLSDINATPKGQFFFRVRQTKSQVVQDQPIPSWTREYLSALILQRRDESESPDAPLFIDYFRHTPAGPISPKTIYRLYKKWVGKHGIIAAPHSARKTFINKLLNDGVPLQLVSKAARHAAISSTERYIAEAKIDESVCFSLRY